MQISHQTCVCLPEEDVDPVYVSRVQSDWMSRLCGNVLQLFVYFYIWYLTHYCFLIGFIKY